MIWTFARNTFTKMSSSRASTSSSSNGSSSCQVPKAFVFDLDGCVWDPEMYQIWGGGAPFKSVNKGEYLVDKRGEKIILLANVREILHELKTDPKWSETYVAVASCCDEPAWAKECIQKFSIGDGFYLKDVFQQLEIHKGAKTTHLKSIAKQSGIALKDMVFFDNEHGNCRTVASLGVTVMLTPDGVTMENFREAIQKFPAPGEVLGAHVRKHW